MNSWNHQFSKIWRISDLRVFIVHRAEIFWVIFWKIDDFINPFSIMAMMTCNSFYKYVFLNSSLINFVRYFICLSIKVKVVEFHAVDLAQGCCFLIYTLMIWTTYILLISVMDSKKMKFAFLLPKTTEYFRKQFHLKNNKYPLWNWAQNWLQILQENFTEFSLEN